MKITLNALENMSRTVHDYIVEAGHLVMDLSRENAYTISYKDADEIVSSADRLSQEYLIRKLGYIIPAAIFVVEEASREEIIRSIQKARSSEWVWIIDPLDGTKNYVSGSPDFGIQVALVHNNDLAAAWIHCPVTHKSAYGVVGRSLELNNIRICTGEGVSKLSQMNIMVAAGDFLTAHKSKCDHLMKGARSVRGTSSCAVDYLDLIEGKLEFLVYRRTYPWDHAPGAGLIKILGGTTKRFNGYNYFPLDDEEGMIACVDQKHHLIAREFAP